MPLEVWEKSQESSVCFSLLSFSLLILLVFFIWGKLSSFEHVLLSPEKNINIWERKTEKRQPGAEREIERKAEGERGSG